jgi:hypothetical protein
MTIILACASDFVALIHKKETKNIISTSVDVAEFICVS